MQTSAKIIVGTVGAVILLVLIWFFSQFSGLTGARLPVGEKVDGGDAAALCAVSCADFTGADKAECLAACRQFSEENQ